MAKKSVSASEIYLEERLTAFKDMQKSVESTKFSGSSKRDRDNNLSNSRPFQNTYDQMHIAVKFAHYLKPYVKLGVLEDVLYEMYLKKLEPAKEGIDYLHYSTMTYQQLKNQKEEGAWRTMVVGGAAGSYIPIPLLGSLIGAGTGYLIGHLVGPQTFHAWQKTMGKIGKKEPAKDIDKHMLELHAVATIIKSKLEKEIHVGIEKKVGFLMRHLYGSFGITAKISTSYAISAYKSYLDTIERICQDGQVR